MKIVISDTKTGKSYGIDLPKDKEGALIGKKMGDKLEGGAVGADGYELEITGGSDNSGFPMRADVSGPRRVGVTISSGAGIRKQKKGMRTKRNVRGSIVSDQIVQINTKVLAAGSRPLEEIFPKAAAGSDKKDEKKK